MKRMIIYTIAIIFFALSANIFSQIPDRTKPPQLPAPKSLKLPAIQKFQLSNGITVVLMEKHEVPLVQLNVVVNVGSADDPEGKSGLANFAMNMLDEGAAGKSSLELADAIDFLGARISTSAGMHSSNINLHTPLSKFDEALKIMGDLVLRPDFPKSELDRIRKERLTTLMQWRDQPTSIASISFNKFLFGTKHPYGNPTLGDETSNKSFTADDFKNFHSKYFKSNNAFITVVGDINKKDLQPKLESVFGKWQKGTIKKIAIENPIQVTDRTIYLIDKPGSAQSVIYIGRLGTTRLAPDYNATVVMNTILGGSFTSRLNDNLREQHGYTYGAGSRFGFGPIVGSFFATASVQTDVTDKALTEFFKELNGIRESIPEDELNRGKNLVALSYPGNFQSVAEIAGQLQEIITYNLPDNYFNEYIGKMLNVTGSDVNASANKYVVPDQMIVVVVGDKAKVEEGIKALNLGELKNLTIEDVLGNVPVIE